MNRLYYILLLTLLVALTATAQEGHISLSQYCERVLDYNQGLKQRSEQLIAAEARMKLSRTNYFPQLSTSFQGTLDLKELEAWSGEEGVYRNHTYLGEVTIQQPIWSGGRVVNQYRASQLEQEQAQLEGELTAQQIYYRATVAYWNCVANNELYRSTQEFVDIVAQQYRMVQTRFENGNTAKSELLMIATQLKEVEIQLSIAQRNTIISQQSLNILIGTPPDSALQTAETIYVFTPNPTLHTLDEVLQLRPDYQSSLLAIRLQEHYRKVELSQYNPNLSLNLVGGWGTTTPNTGYAPDFSGLAALTLHIPIPYSGSRGYSNRAARAAIRIAQWQLSSMRDGVLEELCSAQTRITQSNEQILLAEENMTLATENLQLATFAYNEGRTPISDLLTAQLSWIKARTNTISAHLNHKIAVADYMRVYAQPIHKGEVSDIFKALLY